MRLADPLAGLSAVADLGFGLAAADAYHAMTQDRPHRAAHPPAEAAARFDPDAADAVVAAAVAGRPDRRAGTGGRAGGTADG